MTIKLAYKYSSVELEINPQDLYDAYDQIKDDLEVAYALVKSIIDFDEKENDPTDDYTDEPKKPLPKRIDPPTEKQIRWAKNLGMENPEQRDKAEVAKFIQDHKG